MFGVQMLTRVAQFDLHDIPNVLTVDILRSLSGSSRVPFVVPE